MYIEHGTTAWDAMGNPVLTTSSANTALVQYNIKAITGRDGTQKVSSCQILLPSGSAITIDDSITMPDGSNPEILAVQKETNFDGDNEYVMVFT